MTKMIDVLKRLAELDAGNPNVINPQVVKESADSLAECGGMAPTPSHASINITANSGEEVSGMIKSLMGLAGISPAHASVEQEPVTAIGVDVEGEPNMNSMKDLINAIDSAEEPEMAEDSMNRPYDNSPGEEIGQDGVRQFGDINSGDHRERQKGLPVAKPVDESIVDKLFREYREFVAEGSNKKISEMHFGLPSDATPTPSKGKFTYDSITHPKYGKLSLVNDGGSYMITSPGENGSVIIRALGTQQEIGSKWKAIKQKLGLAKVSEAGKPRNPGQKPFNFDAADLDRLSKIRDLDQLKQEAIALISTESDRPMKPEKIEWFTNAINRAPNGLAIIKMMYDLLLAGDGLGVIGASKGYKSRFKS